MGIKSTMDVSRSRAIERILFIAPLILSKNYLELEKECYEPDYDLSDFVNDAENYQEASTLIGSVETYTNDMIEDILESGFYRFSMFDNYIVYNDDTRED